MSQEVIVVPVASRATGKAYNVVAARSSDEVTLTCTCGTAARGALCKHQMEVLSAAKRSSDPSVLAIRSMLAEGYAARLLGAIQEAESRAAAQRKQVRSLKQQLARFLNGR